MGEVVCQAGATDEKLLQSAWKAGEQAVEMIDWDHVLRYGIEGLGPLREKGELCREVTVCILATVEVSEEIAGRIARALVDSEWNRAR